MQISKNRSIKSLKHILTLIVLALLSCNPQEGKHLSYPYSQWTIGTSGHNITWRFMEGFDYNESFIKAPNEGEWETWYNTIVEYREAVRLKAGRETPYLRLDFPYRRETRIHFDKFAYQLELQPGEEITISGESRSADLPYTLFIDFDLKTKGEELSYVVRRKILAADSLQIDPTIDWTGFAHTMRIPDFPADSFAIVPILRIAPNDTNAEGEVFIREISLHTPSSIQRQIVLASINRYIERQSTKNAFTISDKLAWTHQNWVMGFVFIWDHKFWDPEKGVYLVDEYCQTMENEFGGLQSVVLWHSYPNIGIDEKNQFDLFHEMPGSMDGLKKVVEDFQRNGVRVFLTYNPWDLDTRRPENHDFKELAQVIYDTGADGIFLDTWKSAKGVISIFEVENSIRDEVEKLGGKVAFTTEILPEIKDLHGSDALTSSWGQEIDPFYFTDLSHHKWLMPQHKQYYIKRMTKDRKPILAHGWINGQGIQLWENIFGTMNIWDTNHRQWLRKMNTIWKGYGHLYLTDNWKPFYPTHHPTVVASLWDHGDQVIINLVDTASAYSTIRWEVPSASTHQYFDIWNGTELAPVTENDTSWILVTVNDFGAILQTKEVSADLEKLLANQQRETRTSLPASDPYDQELSLKMPLTYHYNPSSNPTFQPELFGIMGGEQTFICEHIWREGRCYPNMDAAHNHDLVLFHAEGAQRIRHTHRQVIPDYAIMPRVVTNGQFEEFVKASGYQPRFPENFLKHWNGSACPPNIKDEPVVFVSLADARAFADWAGMELPNEWEWQKAAEELDDDFVFNEVFEWNESERFDGYNRFVTLRGGCSRWTTPSSWWYFPGAPYGVVTGGPQDYDSHVKYFLMYCGLDRASTIGFRVVKR